MQLFANLLHRSPHKDWERVVIWDHWAGDVVWTAEMPLAVLYENIPPDCRDTFEDANARLWATVIWGGASIFLGFLLFLGLGSGLITMIVVPFIAGLPFAAWGYFKGYKRFIPSPVWFVRKVGVGENDSIPDIQGIPHTGGTGLPPEIAAGLRKLQAQQTYRAIGVQQQKIQSQSAEGNGTAVAVEEMPPDARLAEFFEPSYFSARALYEVVRGRDVKEHFKSDKKESNKLQNVSMAGMAFGSIGILIVAVLLLG